MSRKRYAFLVARDCFVALRAPRNDRAAIASEASELHVDRFADRLRPAMTELSLLSEASELHVDRFADRLRLAMSELSLRAKRSNLVRTARTVRTSRTQRTTRTLRTLRIQFSVWVAAFCSLSVRADAKRQLTFPCAGLESPEAVPGKPIELGGARCVESRRP